MIFNLMAVAEDAANNGLSIWALVGIIIGGSVILAGVIFGAIISARDTARKADKTMERHTRKRAKKLEPAPAVVVEEKHYDFTNLSEEEKDLIRKYRDSK